MRVSYALERMCITASMTLWDEATLWNLKHGALSSLATHPYCLPALLRAAEGPRQDISGVVVLGAWHRVWYQLQRDDTDSLSELGRANEPATLGSGSYCKRESWGSQESHANRAMTTWVLKQTQT